jgi:transcriptional regulator with XRE-family HTH domain
MTDPRSFGEWLRRERERRGITLRAIADKTKIGAGLLEALERGDVSRWPGGIYRRAFVRGYADTVGLDADLVVANFERVFPSDPSAASAAAPPITVAAEHPELRLALATPAIALSPRTLKSVCRDVAWVLAAAAIGFVVDGAIGFWCAAAIVSLTFHVCRVLGVHQTAIWRAVAERQQRAAAVTLRVLADLAAAVTSSALSGRSRAARS